MKKNDNKDDIIKDNHIENIDKSTTIKPSLRSDDKDTKDYQYEVTPKPPRNLHKTWEKGSNEVKEDSNINSFKPIKNHMKKVQNHNDLNSTNDNNHDRNNKLLFSSNNDFNTQQSFPFMSFNRGMSKLKDNQDNSNRNVVEAYPPFFHDNNKPADENFDKPYGKKKWRKKSNNGIQEDTLRENSFKMQQNKILEDQEIKDAIKKAKEQDDKEKAMLKAKEKVEKERELRKRIQLEKEEHVKALNLKKKQKELNDAILRKEKEMKAKQQKELNDLKSIKDLKEKELREFKEIREKQINEIKDIREKEAKIARFRLEKEQREQEILQHKKRKGKRTLQNEQRREEKARAGTRRIKKRI